MQNNDVINSAAGTASQGNPMVDFLVQFENHPLSPKTDTDLVLDYINKLEKITKINNWNILFDSPINYEEVQIKLHDKIKNINPSVRKENWTHDDIGKYIGLASSALVCQEAPKGGPEDQRIVARPNNI